MEIRMHLAVTGFYMKRWLYGREQHPLSSSRLEVTRVRRRERERDSTFRDENESEKEAGAARHKQEKGECDTVDGGTTELTYQYLYITLTACHGDLLCNFMSIIMMIIIIIIIILYRFVAPPPPNPSSLGGPCEQVTLCFKSTFTGQSMSIITILFTSTSSSSCLSLVMIRLTPHLFLCLSVCRFSVTILLREL
jgi:hypothetical protein